MGNLETGDRNHLVANTSPVAVVRQYSNSILSLGAGDLSIVFPCLSQRLFFSVQIKGENQVGR